MKTSNEILLDAGVDEVLGRISPFEGEDVAPPRKIITLTPHCSCDDAKRTYKLSTPEEMRPLVQAMPTGVPTLSKDNSTCDYCGYYVFMAEYKPRGIK